MEGLLNQLVLEQLQLAPLQWGEYHAISGLWVGGQEGALPQETAEKGVHLTVCCLCRQAAQHQVGLTTPSSRVAIEFGNVCSS